MIEAKNKKQTKRSSQRKNPAKKQTIADLVDWVESLPKSRRKRNISQRIDDLLYKTR